MRAQISRYARYPIAAAPIYGSPKVETKSTSNLAWQRVALHAQPKLEVSSPSDPAEKEADRMADSVMSGSGELCQHCAEERKVQRSEMNGASQGSASSMPQLGGGEPLDNQARTFFEPRFQQSFADVRIHTDDSAAQSATNIGARAYTFGNDIVFAAGEYQPTTREGQHLMAHELTHVTQQSRGDVQPQLMREPNDTVRVVLNSTDNCISDRDLAMAIPGAKSMAWSAVNWFINYSFLDDASRMRVDALLRANFGSSSSDVRGIVRSRIVRAHHLLEAAQNGNLHFDCRNEGDPSCMQGETARMGYVREGEGDVIHICPAFFRATLEERRWNLIHECIHLAGARGPETYYFYFGEITDSDCHTASELAPDVALQNADNYARFIWCLTRPSGTVIRPVTPAP